MYPRNAATPPEIDLGQILQLSDGAIQTTGASVRVKIGTGAWAAGAGTLSCDATSGIWTYLPTQAETNAAYFIIGIYKANCTALSKTVVTSVSTTAGYAGLDWANILAPTTTVNLSGTTVKTATDVETDTQDIQSRLPAALVSGRIDASVGAYQSGLTPPSASSNAAAVRSELTTELTRIDVATSTRLASASYTAPDNASISSILSGVNMLTSRITSTLFSGITSLSSWLGALAGKTADTTTRAEINATTGGASYNETTDSQEAIRDRGDAAWTTGSGGGGGDIVVAPLQATAPNRVAGTEIVTYINDTSDIGPIVVTDGDGDAVDLSSYTLKVCIERKENGTIDDNITPTISGAGNNQVTFTPTAACVNSTTPRKWSLRSTSNGQVFAFGDFKVEWPARLS